MMKEGGANGGRRPPGHLDVRDERVVQAHALAAEVMGRPLRDRLSYVRSQTACCRIEFAELLIGLAREQRLGDPRESLHRAALAVAALDREDGARPRGAATLALAWAEAGNALRICGDLRCARAAFRRAREALRGTSDPLARIDVLRLEAAFRSYRRDYGSAQRLLLRVERIQRGSGPPEALIVTWLGLAEAFKTSDVKRSIGLVELALRLVDPRRHPHLALNCVHNLAGYLILAGANAPALTMLDRYREVYDRFATPRLLIRRRWLEARARYGLGEVGRCEALLTEVRDRFARLACPYEVTLTCVDLALVYAGTGRRSQAEESASTACFLGRGLDIDEVAVADSVLLDAGSRRWRGVPLPS